MAKETQDNIQSEGVMYNMHGSHARKNAEPSSNANKHDIDVEIESVNPESEWKQDKLLD